MSGTDAGPPNIDITTGSLGYMLGSRDDGYGGAELLPPVKRTGKRRKVVNPNNPSTDLSPAEKPTRRTATNSYWSVEEKRRFRNLVAVHGDNVKAIAVDLGGKSERQVANFFDAHRSDLKLDEAMLSASDEVEGRMAVDTKEVSRMLMSDNDAECLRCPPTPSPLYMSAPSTMFTHRRPLLKITGMLSLAWVCSLSVLTSFRPPFRPQFQTAYLPELCQSLRSSRSHDLAGCVSLRYSTTERLTIRPHEMVREDQIL